MDIAEKAEEFINKQTDKVKQRVRNKAIKQAETQMIVAGKKLDELSLGIARLISCRLQSFGFLLA